MPKLKSVADLQKLQEQLKKDMKRRTAARTTITIGMGTCGIAAGARETMHAILEELAKRNIDAHVTTVGCIGMCSQEPLVDIQQGDEPRVTYGHLTADRVPRLIEEHIVNNRIIEEWVIARVGG